MRPLALTAGDPSGIGPDIALAAWATRAQHGVPPFVLLGDPALMRARARLLGLEVRIDEADFDSASALFDRALPVLPLASPFEDSPGRADAGNAAGIIESIDRAVAAVQAGLASAVVTLPIAKKVLYDAGFRHPGHTEYLAHLATARGEPEPLPVMMIAGPELRTVPVTIHVPIADVPRLLTTELIVRTSQVVAKDLRDRFGLDAPRLAVMGLNPHAGEDGSIGREDIEIIAPAVEGLRRDGINAFGPLPADTMFPPRARAAYDVALCMFPDQARIPAKTLAFDEGVNVTLGLPFIRTSPDHGTAFSLAGTGKARPDSLIAALRMADDMARRSA